MLVTNIKWWWHWTFSIKDDTDAEKEEDKADEDNYEEKGKATIKTSLTPSHKDEDHEGWLEKMIVVVSNLWDNDFYFKLERVHKIVWWVNIS